jgi:hypothetical protein
MASPLQEKAGVTLDAHAFADLAITSKRESKKPE